MSDIINLLPDALANQIAAGEVIQRPASAVKELLENAVDSGARKISLIIKDSGKTLIQVIDDGCGMSETDARMAFERHATSKIRSLDDLFSIRTMGFRGEALASIAAIARVELKSRLADREVGTKVLIEGANVTLQEPTQTPPGTSIAIKNLFFNTPARRNFLKSDVVELKHILEEFYRVALANPGIGFSFHHNDQEMAILPPGNLRQRIVAVFGKNYNEKLVPVEEKTGVVDIRGFVGKPEAARKTRGEQYFFVNNRFIRNHYLNHAVTVCFQDIMPEGNFPFFVLFLDIDPARVDVNVHPTKQEIKFDEEKVVYSIVRSAVRHALGKYSIMPGLDFDQEDHLTRHGAFSGNPTFPSATGQPAKAPASGFGGNSFSGKKETSVEGWKKLYEGIAQNAPQTVTLPSDWKTPELSPEPFHAGQEEDSRMQACFQFHNSFIAARIKSGLVIVDQQAAHERIIFERLIRSMANQRKATQTSLFPATISFTPSDAGLLQELLPDLNMLGFDIQPFGANTFIVNGLPAEMSQGGEQALIEQLMEDFKNNQALLKVDRKQNVAKALARQAAVSQGKSLAETEMRNLIDELFACENPYTTPNGKRTFITWTLDEVRQQFQNR